MRAYTHMYTYIHTHIYFFKKLKKTLTNKFNRHIPFFSFTKYGKHGVSIHSHDHTHTHAPLLQQLHTHGLQLPREQRGTLNSLRVREEDCCIQIQSLCKKKERKKKDN